MSGNFKQAVNVLSTKKSIKDKQKAITLSKIERPLSRNVRFFDLSSSLGVKKTDNGTTTTNAGQ